MKKQLVLVGIGNIMFSDDGLGVYAAMYIDKNYIKPSNLTIVDGGTLGFKLMTYYQEYGNVCILSTTSVGKKSGEVFHFNKEDLLNQGVCRQSANEVEVVQMLEICSILDEDMADVDIIAMKPDDIIPVVANLTDSVKEAFPKLIKKTLKVLKNRGIVLEPKENMVPLDEIIQACANPMQISHFGAK